MGRIIVGMTGPSGSVFGVELLPAVTLNSSKPPDAEGGVARPVSLDIEVAGSQFLDRAGSVVPVDRCGLLFGT
jgi:hypothetical protein